MTKNRIGVWKLLVLALAGGVLTYVALSYLLQAAQWPIGDAESYWAAAMRLRHGEPLYLAGIGAEDPLRYLYAPWFAVMWIPLTFLPKNVVMLSWSVVLLAASLLAIRPLLRKRSIASLLVALLAGSFLIWAASRGNVQPLLILGLLVTANRRSGPVWVGIAASLKVVPILYALVWAGRGEWRKVGVCIVVTAVLVVPILLFNIEGYSTDVGARPALIPWLPGQLVVVALTSVVTLLMSRTRYAWIAASAAAMFALPRFVEYNISFALVGTAGSETGRTTYGDGGHRVLASRGADSPV